MKYSKDPRDKEFVFLACGRLKSGWPVSKDMAELFTAWRKQNTIGPLTGFAVDSQCFNFFV